jgi:hypothetical protein
LLAALPNNLAAFNKVLVAEVDNFSLLEEVLVTLSKLLV